MRWMIWTLALLLASIAAANEPAAAPDYTGKATAQHSTGDGKPSADSDTWPQFRGGARDNIAAQATGLARTWPAEGPKVLWQIEKLGMGYSAPAVYEGKAYFHDYDEQAKRWIARCVSLADGKDIWRWSYQQEIVPNHAITRTVPATDGKYVVSLDPKCLLHGFNAATGERLWAKHLVTEYRTVIPQWYNGQCPLIESGRVILGIGGDKVLMAAFDPATGKAVWETPQPEGRRHGMRHASLAAMTVDGVRQYVWCTTRGLVAVAADTGKLLWEHDWRTTVAVAPSPLPLGDGRVFMTSGYKAGSIMIRAKLVDGAWKTEELFRLGWEDFESECQTPVLWKEHIYGVDMVGRLACLNLDGKVLWRWPNEAKGSFGLGSYMIADGMLYILEEGGTLRLVEPDPAGFKELAKAKVLPGHEAWAPLTYFNGKLIARDLNTMVCVEIK